MVATFVTGVALRDACVDVGGMYGCMFAGSNNNNNNVEGGIFDARDVAREGGEFEGYLVGKRCRSPGFKNSSQRYSINRRYFSQIHATTATSLEANRH